MRAVIIPNFGGPEVLEVANLPDPQPSEQELVVRVLISGVNRADLLQRRGLYPPPPGASEVPGLEFVGTVEAIGDKVSRWQVGKPVMGIVAGGGYAQRVVVHEDIAIAVPEALDITAAGAVPEVFMTAFDALFCQAGLQPGETVLIHAVGSGVGTAALQLAKRAGAKTIGTSRTPEKLRQAKSLGLDMSLAGDGDWADAVMDATNGKGVEVILDLVGGPYLAGNQRAIASGGRHVVVGVPGGSRTEIDLRLLMVRRAALFGTVLRARPHEEKAQLTEEFELAVLPGLCDGSLKPVVDRIFTAEQAAAAHRYMEANKNFGKILLTWD